MRRSKLTSLSVKVISVIFIYYVLNIFFNFLNRTGTFKRPLKGIEELSLIPRRLSSKYSVLTSSMVVRPGDIPAWLSCPPAQTSHSIWSMAVTEREAEHSGVLAMSIQVKSQQNISLMYYCHVIRTTGIADILSLTSDF